MRKKWIRAPLAIGLTILCIGGLTILSGVRPFPRAWEPTAVPTIELTATPIPRPLGWHDVARYLESMMAIDILALGESDGKAFAALTVAEDITEDDYTYASRMLAGALVIFGSEDNQELALSFFFEPAGDDPRYRLRFGVLCDVTPGNVENCRGGPLTDGYLEPESALWPGRE